MFESMQLIFAEVCVVVGTMAWLYLKSEEEAGKYVIKYLSGPELSACEVREVLVELHNVEDIPNPKVIDAALRACHRVNDFDLTVGFLESIRVKCEMKKDCDVIYPWIIQQIKPTLDELGISVIEELEVNEPDHCWTKDWDKYYDESVSY